MTIRIGLSALVTLATMSCSKSSEFVAAVTTEDLPRKMAEIGGSWTAPATASTVPVHANIYENHIQLEVTNDVSGKGLGLYSEGLDCVTVLSSHSVGCRSKKAPPNKYDAVVDWSGNTLKISGLDGHVFVRDGAAPSGSSGGPIVAEPAPDPTAQLRWTSASFDGSATVEQNATSTTECTIEGRKGEKTLWKAKICAGSKLDYRFVGPDGEKLVVLYPLPDASKASVGSTTVMTVFKHGKKQYAAVAGATVANWKRLRTAGTSFYWLAGAVDQPGEGPRYVDDGKAVDFETTDGKKVHISLVE